MIDGFYQTLSKEQKAEVADALKSLNLSPQDLGFG